MQVCSILDFWTKVSKIKLNPGLLCSVLGQASMSMSEYQENLAKYVGERGACGGIALLENWLYSWLMVWLTLRLSAAP